MPQEAEKEPGGRKGVPWTPGREPSSLGARSRKAPRPCEVQSEGVRKEAMLAGISPPQACNLLGSSHLISRLACKMTCVVSHR